MRYILSTVIGTIIISGCAIAGGGNQELPVSHVTFLKQGQSVRVDTMTKDVCKTFELSKQEVKDFYRFSNGVTEAELHDEYDLLPCYSVGKIKLGTMDFQWKIRAGGTGAFFNEKKIMLRACDKKCCEHFNDLC